MSDADAVLRRCEGDAPSPAFAVDWQRSLATVPPIMPWEQEPLAGRVRAAGLDDAALAALTAAARLTAADPDLRLVAWHLHRRLFETPELGCPNGGPLLPRLGAQAGAVRLLVSLSFVERLRSAHRARGYPADVTEDTLRQLACFDANHRLAFGVPGVLVEQASWLTTYFRNPYVRLGRLEFELREGEGRCRAFRRADGAVAVLAQPGLRCTLTGMIAADDEECAFVCGGEGRRGHYIDPVGRIRADALVLGDDWRPLWAPGDPTLHVHIPAGGGLGWDACAQSFRRAAAFFREHHGEPAVAAFVCSTWFLDPQVDTVLGSESNPARFRAQVWNFPERPNANGLWFVFLGSIADPAALPRDTSMRRILADFLADGGRWRGGGMLLPLDAIDCGSWWRGGTPTSVR